jgi:membrane-associated protease RseP (regulator of RpoE activity)
MNRQFRVLTLAALVATLPTFLPGASAQEDAPKAEGGQRFEFHRRVPAPEGEARWEFRGPGGLEALHVGPQGYLGVQLIDITPELRRHYGAPEDAGVLIGQVVPDSPAAQAGLQVGDVLTRIDGEPVNGPMDITHRVRSKGDGEPVTVTVLRDGSALDFTAQVVLREGVGVPSMPGLPRVHFVPRGQFEFRGDDGTVVDLENLPDLQWFNAEKMGEVFKSPQWEVAMEQLQSGRGPLLERIDELEKRLAEMETLLKKLDKK